MSKKNSTSVGWVVLAMSETYCLVRGKGSVGASVYGMERPVKFEHTRFLGDKRTQLVYDLDEWTDKDIIDEIVNEGVGLCFGPDTLAEARNRGYSLATAGATRHHRKPRA